VDRQTCWPTSDEEHQLLTNLNTDTPTAREEIAVRFLPLLIRFLERAFPRAAPEHHHDAAEQALLDFLRSPHRFDPARSGLGSYLRMAARRDLWNLLEAERRARRGISLDSVAEPADHRNRVRDEELTWDDPRLAAARAGFDADERATLELLLRGVRKTSAFVNRLGLTHLTADEQVVAVKRAKDRVKKRLVRATEDLR
jgi:RNA polymerase sigma factor (sigma-70 family)